MAKNEKKKENAKHKPKYELFSCVGYIYRLLLNHQRGLAFVGIFTVPISLILSALAPYTPSLILSSLETFDRFSTISLVIVGLLLTKLLFDLVDRLINIRISNSDYYCV